MLDTPRHWVLPPPVDPLVLRQFPDFPPLIVQLLHNRGIVDPAAAAAFLADKPPVTGDPMLMKGVADAVVRLKRAVATREPVAIYGDFDADGITAAALLAEALTALGLAVVPYIPQRSEGYGLHSDALLALAQQGIRLVVTVDCGINSVAEVAAAKAGGLDVIVSDHHRVGDYLPAAVAVINPRQVDCQYPFKELAAVGVALKLAQAALWRLPLAAGYHLAALTPKLLELAAIGTVADVSPLLGENRALVRRGIAALNCSTRPGLLALLKNAGIQMGSIDTGAIGYALGPRLNAAGRVSNPFTAYRLLVSKTADESAGLANELEAANQERQRMLAEALSVAREQVLAAAQQRTLAGEPLDPLLLVAEPGLPSGVVGLVAGRLVDEFHRPSFVAEVADGECRGSARSIDGFNVAEALASCGDLLTRYGGHAQAAGFSAPLANLPALRARLTAVASQQLDESMLCRRLNVDSILRLGSVDEALYVAIQRLAPFGRANPAPVFLSKGIKVIAADAVGREGAHLKLRLHDGERIWPAIAFRMGAAVRDIAPYLDIVYTLQLNEWNGRRTLELRVIDWRPAV